MRWLKNLKYRVLLPLLFKYRGKEVLLKAPQALDKPRLLFILGSGRNGSTLLARLANQHQDIFLPPEQYALPYTISQRVFKPHQDWAAYCNQQLKLYFQNNQHWKWDSQDHTSILKKALQLEHHEHSPANLYRLLLHEYQLKFKESVLYSGDHSPITTEFFPYILPNFPDAHYLFLVRHPFDVILSYAKLEGNRSQTWKKACQKWNNSLQALERLQKEGKKVYLLKYEDLVNDSSKYQAEVFTFLGLDPLKLRAEQEASSEADPLGAKNYSYHENLYKPVSNAAVGRWKDKLPIEIQRQARPLLQANAAKYGYDLEP